MKKTSLMAVALLMAWSARALATGFLIPKDPDLPPLAIKHQRVTIEIADQVARTHVDQVFQNNVDRDLEATYVFPLPKGAAVSDFAMYIGGQRASGQLLEKREARKIYEEIVRRMRDPGILEYMDNNLFRVRVFPVPKKGHQRIEISYSETLKLDAGICRYVYPLRTGERASRTLDDFTLSARISAKTPIKSVYSPSHKIGLTRKDDHNAIVGFEEPRSLLDRDFVLYYTVSEKDIGMSLLAHRTKGTDGYFMLMISPKTEVKEEQILPKDICFVMDTSGSMAGQKIAQAKNALKYCLENLNKEDRFQIVRFSTSTEPFAQTLIPATPENVKNALAFVEKMSATGGTAIDQALKEALELKADERRPYIVVFLTDGLPTIGEQDPKNILQRVRERVKPNMRIFSFGVGHDVDTHLLDEISNAARGHSEYVKPDEDIELKVSLFYEKISKPVLAGLKLELPKVEAYDIYPRELPDLFKGTQLVLFGRYRGFGNVAVKLAGELGGKLQEFVYDATFPEEEVQNDFIKRLWATRKVGYLLDEIRLRGEKKELTDEVIQLSKEFNIITPYTSYLVVDDKEIEQARRVGRGSGFSPAAPPAAAGPTEARRGMEDRRKLADALKEREQRELQHSNAPSPDAQALSLSKERTGEGAVRMAEVLGKMKRIASATAQENLLSRHIGGKTFHRIADIWVDGEYKEGLREVRVKYASSAYFALLDAKPEWREIFMLGEKIILVIGKDRCVIIGEEGTDELSKKEIADLLGKE